MARNPRSEKMEKFTAVVPSTTQGNLSQKLAAHGTASPRSEEQEEQMKKWRGLTTADLTDGVSFFLFLVFLPVSVSHLLFAAQIMETRMPDGEGGQRIVKYDVPLTKMDGKPQPVAYMLVRFLRSCLFFWFFSQTKPFVLHRKRTGSSSPASVTRRLPTRFTSTTGCR